MPSGLRKKLSGLSRIFWRVSGRTTTGIDDDQGHANPVRLEAAGHGFPLDFAAAAVLGAARREAVAPMKIMAPNPAAFIAGMTW